jgi:hemoglobin
MWTRSTIARLSCGLTVALLSLACGKNDTATADSPAAAPAETTAKAARTLFDRLGGQTAITAVVDSFVAIVVKRMLVDQICAQTGGPCTYAGRSMKEAHTNMGVTEGEFNALVEDLVTTLNAFNVPKPEQDELLNALGTMKGDIVEVPGSTATSTPLPKTFNPAPKQ